MPQGSVKRDGKGKTRKSMGKDNGHEAVKTPECHVDHGSSCVPTANKKCARCPSSVRRFGQHAV